MILNLSGPSRKRCIAGIAALACAALAAGCATAPPAGPGETGWQSDHAYRVRAAGTPNAGEKNPAARRAQAKRAAEVMARHIVGEIFTVQTLTELAGRDVPQRELRARVKAEFGETINSGAAVSERYDNDGNCAIIYEVKAKHMKQNLAKLRNRLLVGR